MIEDRSIVHVVLQQGDAHVLLPVDLAKQVKLFQALLDEELSMRPNVANLRILPLGELFLGRDGLLRAAVVVALQPTCHAEVVHEERVLVDVLEHAELALHERKLEALAEIEVGIKPGIFVLLLLGDSRHWKLQHSWLHLLEALHDVGSMEGLEVFVAPVELEVGEVADALRVVELLGDLRRHRRARALVLLLGIILIRVRI